MGRYLVVTWAGGGNVAPMLVLAEGLAERGHTVGALAPASLAERVASAGASIVAEPAGWLAAADEVLVAVERFAPDVLVVDYMLTSALCGAEAAELLTVALVHTLYGAILHDGAPDPIGMGGSVDDLNQVRAGHDLDPIERHADLLDACALVLVAAPQHLDLAPAGTPPGHLVYTGPLLDGSASIDAWTPPVEPARDAPLVVVSMGTAGSDPRRETEVTQRILDALGGLPVRGLVNLPDYLASEAFNPPENVELAGYVPHSSALPHARLVITHAGLGTVNAALAHGVRMVCLPLDREQPANAEAVERIGAGTVVDPSAPVDDLRAAIERALQLDPPQPVLVDDGPALDRLESLVTT